jgi:4-hydroxyphenylacetate 3-hydroxylase C terminal
MMIGAALFNARQTGLDKQQAVQEKLALLACYREGINAHLTAAIAMAEESPGGLLMPNQSLLYTGRVLASSQLNTMMHLCRELCGGQICVTPDFAAFQNPETAAWLDKYYSIGADWQSEDRRRLLAFARGLLNSDYAGHRLPSSYSPSRRPLRTSPRSTGISTGTHRSASCTNPLASRTGCSGASSRRGRAPPAWDITCPTACRHASFQPGSMP